jgi:hypothetical protein
MKKVFVINKLKIALVGCGGIANAHAGYKDMAIPLGFYESAHLGRTVKINDVEELRLEGYQQEINEKLRL